LHLVSAAYGILSHSSAGNVYQQKCRRSCTYELSPSHPSLRQLRRCDTDRHRCQGDTRGTKGLAHTVVVELEFGHLSPSKAFSLSLFILRHTVTQPGNSRRDINNTVIRFRVAIPKRCRWVVVPGIGLLACSLCDLLTPNLYKKKNNKKTKILICMSTFNLNQL
jgi:hypothetical protein